MNNDHTSPSRRRFLRHAIGATAASALLPGYSFSNSSIARPTTGSSEIMPAGACGNEPHVALAKLWWPDQRNIWTPIGWKDHFFRFNVLYNGTIISEPFSDLSARKNAVKFKGDDFLVSFTPWPDANVPDLPGTQTPQWTRDGGHGKQGWKEDTATPVLWTDFPLQEGLVM